jgi:hypothetical protein
VRQLGTEQLHVNPRWAAGDKAQGEDRKSDRKSDRTEDGKLVVRMRIKELLDNLKRKTL